MVLANYLRCECNWCWPLDLLPMREWNFEVATKKQRLYVQNHISMGSLFVQAAHDLWMVQLNVMSVNWLSMLNACCTNDDAVVDLLILTMRSMNLSNANVMLADSHSMNDVLGNVDERPLHECFVPRACVASLHFVLGSI